jgi:hypothetical protein
MALALGCLVGAATPRPASAAPDAPPSRTHGMTIPAVHPRLFFDAAALQRARAWFKKNRFTPRGWDVALAYSQAVHGLLADSAESCRAALTWAIAQNDDLAANATNPSNTYADRARWYGEVIILSYDWCYRHLTPQQRAQFIPKVNAWLETRRRAEWGAIPMHQNNYYWGVVRNEMLWGIASYEENAEAAERFLSDAVDARVVADFDAARAANAGGVGQEGAHYGPYLAAYSVIPFTTAARYGRDLYAESPFWQEAVYATLYATTPAPTVSEWPQPGHKLGYVYFTHSDMDPNRWSPEMVTGDADYMTLAAMRWKDGAGGYARRWLETVKVPASIHLRALDEGGPSLPFTGLPLDYYAPGVKNLYGRSAWTPTATAYFLQLGDRDGRHVGGHQHIDWGSWQLWRNGRFLSRETPGYQGTDTDAVAGYAGRDKVQAAWDVPHNVLLVQGVGITKNPYPHNGDAVVTRLESRPRYAYVAADLTPTRGYRKDKWNPHFLGWVREFVFLRELETLVVLDRVESDHAGDTKTFLAHCETQPVIASRGATCQVGNQALSMTTLVPASASYRVVAEGARLGQYRIEVDTTPGTAQSLVVTVLQARDASARALVPEVVDGGRTLTVRLDAATSLTFEKGMTSSGGSVTVGGETTALRKDVQGFAVTEHGPAWK